MQVSTQRQVAIVGSGPSGFYAAEALLASGLDVAIDLIERLPVPFGLVRYGVAPDHPKLKEVTRVFTALANDSRLRFMGHVTVGRDVSVNELLECYDAVIVACGANSDRRMRVPGEELAGSHPASDFVGWYNAHPDHAAHVFDLSGSTATIVGHGNVAIDICRILAKGPTLLGSTDIAAHALETLARSEIHHIHLIGRRGPAQMKFTAKELRELGTLPGWDVVVEPDALVLDTASAYELAQPQSAVAARNVQFLREMSQRPRSNNRTIEFRFLRSPVELIGNGSVERLVLDKNMLSGEPFKQHTVATGETETIATSTVFRSIGYAGVPFPGLPFDASSGVIPNLQGRVLDNGAPQARTYVTGWIKRGPTGIIGTNRADSIETVASLLTDWAAHPLAADGREGYAALRALLSQRGIRVTSFDDWRTIDEEEIRRGKARGQIRAKIVDIDELLDVAVRKPGKTLASDNASIPQPYLQP